MHRQCNPQGVSAIYFEDHNYPQFISISKMQLSKYSKTFFMFVVPYILVTYTVDPRVRPAWHTTNLGYDQNFCFDQISSYDPRQRQLGEHISDITCNSLRALAVFSLFCRRDHANSSYKNMYSINKYRVTEKGCVSLKARSSINQALRPAWRS
jgi:hypothetical protein